MPPAGDPETNGPTPRMQRWDRHAFRSDLADMLFPTLSSARSPRLNKQAPFSSDWTRRGNEIPLHAWEAVSVLIGLSDIQNASDFKKLRGIVTASVKKVSEKDVWRTFSEALCSFNSSKTCLSFNAVHSLLELCVTSVSNRSENVTAIAQLPCFVSPQALNTFLELIAPAVRTVGVDSSGRYTAVVSRLLQRSVQTGSLVDENTLCCGIIESTSLSEETKKALREATQKNKLPLSLVCDVANFCQEAQEIINVLPDQASSCALGHGVAIVETAITCVPGRSTLLKLMREVTSLEDASMRVPYMRDVLRSSREGEPAYSIANRFECGVRCSLTLDMIPLVVGSLSKRWRTAACEFANASSVHAFPEKASLLFSSFCEEIPRHNRLDDLAKRFVRILRLCKEKYGEQIGNYSALLINLAKIEHVRLHATNPFLFLNSQSPEKFQVGIDQLIKRYDQYRSKGLPNAVAARLVMDVADKDARTEKIVSRLAAGDFEKNGSVYERLSESAAQLIFRCACAPKIADTQFGALFRSISYILADPDLRRIGSHIQQHKTWKRNAATPLFFEFRAFLRSRSRHEISDIESLSKLFFKFVTAREVDAKLHHVVEAKPADRGFALQRLATTYIFDSSTVPVVTKGPVEAALRETPATKNFETIRSLCATMKSFSKLRTDFDSIGNRPSLFSLMGSTIGIDSVGLFSGQGTHIRGVNLSGFFPGHEDQDKVPALDSFLKNTGLLHWEKVLRNAEHLQIVGGTFGMICIGSPDPCYDLEGRHHSLLLLPFNPWGPVDAGLFLVPSEDLKPFVRGKHDKCRSAYFPGFSVPAELFKLKRTNGDSWIQLTKPSTLGALSNAWPPERGPLEWEKAVPLECLRNSDGHVSVKDFIKRYRLSEDDAAKMLYARICADRELEEIVDLYRTQFEITRWMVSQYKKGVVTSASAREVPILKAFYRAHATNRPHNLSVRGTWSYEEEAHFPTARSHDLSVWKDGSKIGTFPKDDDGSSHRALDIWDQIFGREISSLAFEPCLIRNKENYGTLGLSR